MNLLQILNEVLSQSGFLKRGSFMSSQDADDIQMGAIANRVAYEILNHFDWPEAEVIGGIMMQDGITLYELPEDFQSLVPDSEWTDAGVKADLLLNKPEWFTGRLGTGTGGSQIQYRLRGRSALEVLEPNPGETLTFSYITKYPILNQSGQLIERFTADSDRFLLDDQLLVLGVQSHWAQTKMFPTAEQWRANYNAKLNEAIGRHSGGKTIGGSFKPRNRSPYTPLWK
jgi:hypothetical protein